MIARRTFLSGAASASAVAATGFGSRWASAASSQPLSILLLGGTRFIGVPITEIALARGHKITYFNRGKTNADLFPQIERIQGDRDGQIEGLRGRKFDAVIDTSGYVPRHVRLTAELLAPVVKQYVFVSSISVYPNFAQPRDESSDVGALKDPSIEKVDGETYGPLKAACEAAAEAAMPGRVTTLRPGLIVGPHDSTDRFTYWPARAARGGDMLAPGKPTDGVQIIDARDLAAFVLDTLEKRIFGKFNLVTPPHQLTIGAIVNESVRSAIALAKPNPPPHPVWAPASFLQSQKVEGWSDMPVWVDAKGDEAAFASVSCERAIKAGLEFTPLRRTVDDTLAWHLKRPAAEQQKLKAGISPEREKEVLAALLAKAG